MTKARDSRRAALGWLLGVPLAVPFFIGGRLGAGPLTRGTGPEPSRQDSAHDDSGVESNQLFGVSRGQGIRGARVVRIVADHYGAGSFVLELSGVHGQSRDRFQVDVLKTEAPRQGPVPIAHRGTLSFFISNVGDGSKHTTEARGLAVYALAAASRDSRGSDLLTFSERQRRHGHRALDVPVADPATHLIG